MSQFAYDYNPAKTVDYRQTGIQNNRFFAWTAENMYRTSYASSYTEVNILLSLSFILIRNHKNPKTTWFQAMAVSFLVLNPKLNSERAMLKLPRKASVILISARTNSNSAPQGKTHALYNELMSLKIQPD